jgi:hypothetical protein
MTPRSGNGFSKPFSISARERALSRRVQPKKLAIMVSTLASVASTDCNIFDQLRLCPK